MTNSKKIVIVEKDGVRAEATQATFKGLLQNGWTVVDDGDKDNTAPDEEVLKLEEQEQQLFDTDTKE